MLHIFKGPQELVLRERILEHLLSRTGKGEPGQIWMTPEQYSFEAERTLCRLGGDTVCRYAEVLSFSRLAGRVESEYGGCGRLWLDQGGRFLAASQAVDHVKSRLKLYASVCQRTEFLEMFLHLVDELGAYGVTTEDLTAAAKRYTGSFAVKLSELALLFESYFAVKEQAEDPILRLQGLRDTLRREDYCWDKTFYISGFSDFTAVETEILDAIILSAREVYLALPVEQQHGPEIYASSAAAAEHFRQLCARHGVECRETEIAFLQLAPADLHHFHKNVSAPGSYAYPARTENVHCYQFPTKDGELRFCVSEIRRLMQTGTRCREIAVVLANQRDGNAMENLLQRGGVPYYHSRRMAVSENPVASVILYALRAISGGLDRDDVLCYLSSGATALTDDQCDRLENYAIRWNIHGSRWLEPWTMHPDGLDSQWDDDARRQLAQLNLWRELGICELSWLRDELAKGTTVAAYSEAVYDFMERLGLAQTLQSISDQLYDSGDYDGAMEYSQIYEILVNVLEQSARMMADCTRSVQEYDRLVEKTLSQYHVSTVPASLDQVLVGTAAAVRGKEIAHLFVVGAADGVFPPYGGGEGLFTEEERKKLLSDGMSIALLRVDAVERELGGIYQALRCATHSLTMSCGGEEPAFLLTKAANMFGGFTPAPTAEFVLDDAEAASAYLRTGKTDARNPATHAIDRKRNYTFGRISSEHLQKLYGETFSFSPTRIDQLASCRFAYFLKYGLKAEQRREEKFNAAAFGNFVHAVLENTGKMVMENGGFTKISEAELTDYAEQAMDDYAEQELADMQRVDPCFSVRFRRDCGEALAVVKDLWRELRQSQFQPASFELEFRDGGVIPAVCAEGEHSRCKLKGKVDRVDTFVQNGVTYVRIVDYKSGKKMFDYSEIADGEGMQMLLYLFALQQGGGELLGDPLQPAGVLYHPARRDYQHFSTRPSQEKALKAQRENVRRKGMLCDSGSVLTAMEPGEEHIFLPNRKECITPQQMQDLQKHVFSMLGKLADQLSEGEILPNPIERGKTGSCEWCQYAEVCQKDRGLGTQRSRRVLSREEFFEMLRREDDHG